MTKLSAVFQEARSVDAGCGVVLVISGWDGLTTNDLTFGTIDGWGEGLDVTLRFYVEENGRDDGSRVFRDVKLSEACEVLSGDIVATDENPSLKAFFENYRGIQANKQVLSVLKQDLNERSWRRNTFPRPEDFAKWTCSAPNCDHVFRTLELLTSHRARLHQQWTDDARIQWLTCSFCQGKLTDTWSRDRHIRLNCPENPDSEKSKKPVMETRNKRGSMIRVQSIDNQPRGSDNGLKPYLSIDPADFHKAPRINPEDPIIYRGEVFCRHPDCSSKKVTRYTQKSIVRKHYRKEHGIEYRSFSKALGAFDEKPHIDGLQWIAINVQRGQEQAGMAPVPQKW
ncbi:hypothetical protein N7475_010014 [Penicillium sp. IBT 31633x]|nr:hypothetical protein N7475_010014 [Penicillium sp. IBT 31633x]